MAEGNVGKKYGPVCSPMEDVPNNGKGHDAAENCEYNGWPGLPKGTDDIIDQVTLFKGGAFGKVKTSE